MSPESGNEERVVSYAMGEAKVEHYSTHSPISFGLPSLLHVPISGLPGSGACLQVGTRGFRRSCLRVSGS